ncbi:hypothetical protein V6N11_001602 [Hibiscus sabdariffa]|uniref:Uncharacterized protein n=1 Tax=Hibiscus sabdariffa TaxID=183260 RepID=A0ABR2S0G3_9ROSI
MPTSSCNPIFSTPNRTNALFGLTQLNTTYSYRALTCTPTVGLTHTWFSSIVVTYSRSEAESTAVKGAMKNQVVSQSFPMIRDGVSTAEPQGDEEEKGEGSDAHTQQ